MRNEPGPKRRKGRFAFSFDYTAAVKNVCEDIVARVSEFSHVDMSRVAVSFTQSRNNSKYGVYASLTPLRFENGSHTTQKHSRTWEIQRVLREDGSEYLYILFVCVPRFMNLALTEKLETIVHELYHIGPEFDGDLRRFQGRCYAHGASSKKYDQRVRQLLKKWLDQDPPPELWNFLQLNFTELRERFGPIGGLKIPAPKLFPVTKTPE